MTVPMDEKPTAPTASAADATEQTVQVVETSMERKDASTELTTKDGQVETKPKEEAKPSLNYYFVGSHTHLVAAEPSNSLSESFNMQHRSTGF